MRKCPCHDSGHGHDGKVCEIPLGENEYLCLRCSATMKKDDSELDDTGLEE